MTEGFYKPRIPKPPAPSQPKPARVTRQRRERLNRDAEYLVLRDIYLEENPCCVICPTDATEVHHICRGIYRHRSLLNQDSWLGVCHDCHEHVESMTVPQQIKLKLFTVKKTIERLRK